jgi:uncharacterized protein
MKNYPDLIPVFPLNGVIYFPKTNLPLNIFEQRYLNLVNDAFNNNKLIGMVQPEKKGDDVYKIGCLGKISDFQKSRDGRILVNLTGITRFEVLSEIQNEKMYREFKVSYKNFLEDLSLKSLQIDSKNLIKKAKIFLNKNGLILNWKEFERLDCTQQINTLAMIAPITNEEKQKLLETITLIERVRTLESIMSFYLYEGNFYNQTVQ